MKTVYTKSGPISERPYYEDDEIEQICIDELCKTDLLPQDPGPIRIERFIEKRFGINVRYDDLPEGILGFTKFGQKGVEDIVIARALDEEGTESANRRIRSTLAHEGGHGLLHAHLFYLGIKPNKLFDEEHDNTPHILCRDVAGVTAQSKDYQGKWWEFHANRAMASLLLPRFHIEKAIKPYMEKQGTFGLEKLIETKREEIIKSFSRVFEVNPIVVRLRIEQLYPLTASNQLSL